MSGSYRIYPRIGVARLGNSPDEFYLSPESTGGLPLACTKHGNLSTRNGEPYHVDEFKDKVGRVKRQAAKFYVFKETDTGMQKIQLSDDDIDKIVWTVHIANKKPIWYTFSELQGNLEFGEDNSYENQHIPRNNPDVTAVQERKKLIIDPGPRSISRPETIVEFSRYNIPADYEHGSFPPLDAGGQQIDTLGDLRMDDNGNLVVLPGPGHVTGSGDITSFRGAGGYWDDIADGYVLATIHLNNGETIDAEPAWLLVGSPKYAPELVNITTAYDTMYDVAVRFMDAEPDMYNNDNDTADSFPDDNGYTPLNGYNPDYEVNFHSQVKPVLERMQAYRWVADIPYLSSFANPAFDMTDASEKNRANREKYFSYFRVPVLPQDYDKWMARVRKGPNQLFSPDGLPLMPLNSGDNSVTNTGPIYKFETLSPTQFFFMNQWAAGKFNVDEPEPVPLHLRLDQGSVGNCVGAPFSPGIEITWSIRNASIYEAPLRLKLAHFEGKNADLVSYYDEYGLSISRDEAEGLGCEPGDLTKRMAIPWQADFHECTVQSPSLADELINQFADGTGIQVPPAYYVYWWPPQSPMHVVSSNDTPDSQVLDAYISDLDSLPIVPSGRRVPYQRGIDSTQSIIDNWARLGFIINRGTDVFPYFVEVERNHNEIAQYKLNKRPGK